MKKLRQNQALIKPRKNRLPFLLGWVVVMLLVAQVVVSNGLANTGTQINDTEVEIEKYTYENALLKEQIASASSLLTLSQKAQELGFVQDTSPVYLTDKNPVALDLR